MIKYLSQWKLGSIACCVTMVASGCWHIRGSIPAPLPVPPAPLGSSVNPLLEMQELQGEANDFVVYQHEFIKDTAELNPDGFAHLQQIAARASQTSFPIIVEMSEPTMSSGQPGFAGCSSLDQMRRERVAASLTLMGAPVAAQRVVVGPPLSAGLTFGEAEGAYRSALGSQSGIGGGSRGGQSARGGGF